MFFFFFNDTATTEIYTLSLHDALPIFSNGNVIDELIATPGNVQTATINRSGLLNKAVDLTPFNQTPNALGADQPRSEEHTSELQSLTNLVCRLLLEKKKNQLNIRHGQH